MKQLILFLLLTTIALSNDTTDTTSSISEENPRHSFSVGVFGGIDYLSSTWLENTSAKSIHFKGSYTLNSRLTLFGSFLRVRNNDFQFGSRFMVNNIFVPSLFYTRHSFKIFDFAIYEHNLSICNRFTTPERLFRFRGDLGWNFRFVDFGDDDLYPTSFLIWSAGVLASPTERLEINLLLDNSRYDTPLSLSYIELELQGQWRFPHDITASVATGIAFSGTFAVAGFLDRFFLQLGIIYEI